MRLIDARIAAVELAKFMAYEANMENGVAGYHHTKDDFIDVAKELIENVPVIEAEPVRRGRWLFENIGKPNEHCVCSECGTQVDSDEAWHYCPNCGAMDGGEEQWNK